MKKSKKTKTKKSAATAARSKAKVAAKPAHKAAAKTAHKHPAKVAPKPMPKSMPKPAVKVVAKTITKVVTKFAPKVAPKIILDKPEVPASPGQPQPFRLTAIERAEPPMGADGKNWYRYTITQGVNAIHGYLQGSATGVKHAAEQIVGQLNERRAGRWGYRTTRATAPAPSAS